MILHPPDDPLALIAEFTGLPVARVTGRAGALRLAAPGLPKPSEVAVLPPGELVGIGADRFYHHWLLARDGAVRWVAVGPFLPFPVSEAALARIRVGLARAGAHPDPTGLREHYDGLAVLSRQRQHSCLELVAALLAGHRPRRPAGADGFFRAIESVTALRRAEQLPTYDYFAVKLRVREGLLKGPDRILYDYLRRTFEFNIPDLIKGDPLRTRKDLSLTFLSVLVKTAIEEGLETWRAFIISDHFLVAIEGAETVIALDRLLFDAIVRLSGELRAGGLPQPGAAVRSCLSAVADGLPERVRLKDLAARSGMTPEHLSRRFHAETGRTFRGHVAATRLAEARRLLLFSEVSCAEIAHLTGFSSPSHFVRAARRAWGITPGRLRSREGGPGERPAH